MAIRKFGRSDDQRIVKDEKDTQGVRKEASTFTPKDREELRKEIQSK